MILNFRFRREAGHSLKSSVNYSMARGTRDCSFFPTEGYYLKSFTEYSGLFGTVNYFKQILNAQYYYKIFDNLVLSFTSRCGVLLPLNKESSILDRFFLGGPLSVRGFNLDGIGPRSGKYSFGGDIFAELGSSITFPFTRSTSKYILGHIFINGGSLIELNKKNTIKTHFDELLNNFNFSIGIGTIFKVFSSVRLEVNVGYPILKQEQSVFQKGLQFGMGIEFL